MKFLEGYKFIPSKLPKYEKFREGIFVEAVPRQLAQDIIKDEKQKHEKMFKDQQTKVNKIKNNKNRKVEELKLKKLVETSRSVITTLTNIVDTSDDYNILQFYQNYDTGRFINPSSIVEKTRSFKHTIFQYAGYNDVDGKKFHPTVVYALSHKNGDGDKVENMKAVIVDFDTQLKEAQNHYNPKLTKYHVKKLYNMLLYGGTLETWSDFVENPSHSERIKYHIKPLKLKTDTDGNIIYRQFDINYQNEAQWFMNKIWEANCNKEDSLLSKLATYTDYHLDRDTRKELNYGQKQRRFCSYYLQAIENHSLYITFNYLLDNGYIEHFKNPKDKKTYYRCSLEKDGLCFQPLKQITNDTLEGINEANFIEMGIKITYANKTDDYKDFAKSQVLKKYKNKLYEAFKLETCDFISKNLKKYFNNDSMNNPNIIKLANQTKVKGSLFLNEDHLINSKERIIFLDSPMGSGKTRSLNIYNEVYKSLPSHTNIMMISPRQSFAVEKSKEMNLLNYMDCKPFTLSSQNDIIISIESLYKYQDNTCGVLILDEVESVLKVFSSPTVTEYQRCIDKFTQLIRSADKIICADAFITQRSINFMTQFLQEDENMLYIYNDAKPAKQIAFKINHNEIDNHISNSVVDNNENVYVCCGSAEHVNILRQKLIDNYKQKHGKDISHSVKAYYAENALWNDKPSSKKEFTDVKTYWKTTIVEETYNVYFEEQYLEDYISLCYINIECEFTEDIEIYKNTDYKTLLKDNNILDEETYNGDLQYLQKQITINYIFKTRAVLVSPIITIGVNFTDDDPTQPYFHKRYLIGYSSCCVRDITQAKHRIRNTTNLYYCHRDKRRGSPYRLFHTFEEYKSCVEAKKALIDKMNIGNISQIPQEYHFITYFNEYEDALSNLYYNEMLDMFLEWCGYTIDTTTCFNKEVEKEDKIDVIEFPFNYYELDIIDYTESTELSKSRKHTPLSNTEELKLGKYYLKQKVSDTNISEDIMKNLLRWFLKDYNKRKLQNIYDELYTNKKELIQRDIDKNKYVERLKLDAKRIQYIKNLNHILNLQHSLDEKEIDSQSLSKALTYIQDNITDIVLCCNSRIKKNAKNPQTQSMNLLKSLYKKHSGLDFVNYDRPMKAKQRIYLYKTHTDLPDLFSMVIKREEERKLEEEEKERKEEVQRLEREQYGMECSECSNKPYKCKCKFMTDYFSKTNETIVREIVREIVFSDVMLYITMNDL